MPHRIPRPYRRQVIEAAAFADAQSAVLEWYASNGRDLAFRQTSDPWAILVSEVMAQQTQAARAAEAWTRFMTQFPTPASLAGASPVTVIRAWRGLGYNRRALGLRAAAIAIVDEHGGRVPASLDALVRLPGIGPYTARAVLAIAFGRPLAALDVNTRRVIGRAWFGGSPPVSGELQTAADDLVPEGETAAWTHALMDIGAAFCRPRDPRCEACPLEAVCAYRGQPAETRAPVAPHHASSTTARPRFESTSRWLRGRIVDRLRDATDDAWVRFSEAIGEHDVAAVALAIEQLANEGMLERKRAPGLAARIRPDPDTSHPAADGASRTRVGNGHSAGTPSTRRSDDSTIGPRRERTTRSSRTVW